MVTPKSTRSTTDVSIWLGPLAMWLAVLLETIPLGAWLARFATGDHQALFLGALPVTLWILGPAITMRFEPMSKWAQWRPATWYAWKVLTQSGRPKDRMRTLLPTLMWVVGPLASAALAVALFHSQPHYAEVAVAAAIVWTPVLLAAGRAGVRRR